MVPEKIREYLRAREPLEHPFEREQLAAAALMVECARIDGEFSDDERHAICRIARDKFGLDEQTCQSLVEMAERRNAEVWHDWIFLQEAREGFDEEERREIVRMLWEVARADGEVHRLEEHLIRRIAKELGVPEEATREAHGEGCASS